MTQIELEAWKGWHYFRDKMIDIWKSYTVTGEEALKVNFEKDDEKFKLFFTQVNNDMSEFKKIIRRFWEDNYHFVADNYKQLLQQYDKFLGLCPTIDDLTLSLVPETEDQQAWDINGRDQAFSITKSFYKAIRRKLEDEELDEIFLTYDRRLFKITVSYTSKTFTYDLVHIREVDAININ